MKTFNYHGHVGNLYPLRHKAHKLLDAIFPKRVKRYMWLKTHFPKVNMSKMDRRELNDVIWCLESKINGNFCILHKKYHEKAKIKK